MLALGCDHGGYRLKEIIKDYLDKKSIQYKDFGSFSEESVDYPEIAINLSEEVAKGNYDKGILCCGTGVGVSIASNKVKGIRAALVGDCFTAKATREHNDSNVLCLGGRVIGEELALMIIDIWLNTEFIGKHHTKRLDQIADYENK
ncbi:ribose 5-phosphate isomerase B [Clostridium sp. YIM B02505]|uniref:Ribose 5-phosphate isomerase B n=1 Tax=Clostridium yunnanense TaxID=2800325 RepID=A0ABS1EW90_9CLOT|nr:ribose 5-phosphate isomerase B [Clostridium yunnanense]MBK1813651.1 ribose 5-phosphate isomerase B [Clostridium yunnanense]